MNTRIFTLSLLVLIVLAGCTQIGTDSNDLSTRTQGKTMREELQEQQQNLPALRTDSNQLETNVLSSDSKPTVPEAATAQFNMLKEKYANGLSTLLYSCTKGGQTIYTVHGTAKSGMSGERAIFNAQGELIETWDWNPNTGFSVPEDKINTGMGSGYDCKLLERSPEKQ